MDCSPQLINNAEPAGDLGSENGRKRVALGLTRHKLFDEDDAELDPKSPTEKFRSAQAGSF